MLFLNAEIRKNVGKKYSRKLRHVNKIPAIIYGNKKQTIAIELNYDTLVNNNVINHVFKENIIILVNNQKIETKIHNMQYHFFKPKVIHIDFIRI